MKKSTLPILLFAAAMLVSCDAGTVAVPGTTAASTDAVTAVRTTDSPVLSATETVVAETTTDSVTTPLPVTTTVPITYPTLYETSKIMETHSNVVPVETIDSFAPTSYNSVFYSRFRDEFGSYDHPTFARVKDYLDSLNPNSYGTPNYEFALVTPLEITPNGRYYYIHVAIDYVYESRIEAHEMKYFTDELDIYFMAQNWIDGWILNEDEIPITTTGGKYVMLLYTDTDCMIGVSPEDEYRDVFALPLTWELDMDSVPGSTGDNWNRPPYIGNAEDYYAFGFGDVWERYMAE